jgi:RNase H-fold protein (predicted Holliday junction resolvase)
LHLSGVNKKRREDKSTLDRISATLILQSFLDSQKTNAL